MKQKNKVVLVAVVLAAITGAAITAFMGAREISQREACLNNLRMMTAPMVCCVPLVKHLNDGDKLDPKEVCQYMKGATMPVCPAGGTYEVTWIVGGPTPKCSVHGDLLWKYDHVKTLKEIEDRQAGIREITQ